VPLTLPAIGRALAAEGLALPTALAPLRGESDARPLRAVACAWLDEIDPGGAEYHDPPAWARRSASAGW